LFAPWGIEEGGDNFLNVVFGLEWVSKRSIKIDGVDVFTAIFLHCEVSVVAEFMHNAMHGALSDANEVGYFTEAYIWLLGNTDENMRMVG
jgi:hypothetical protein